jgi:GEVED domain/Secretion system C-terminal sorting domain
LRGKLYRMTRFHQPYCLKKIRILILFTILNIIAFRGHSQIIFTEGFEGDFTPPGWSVQSYTPNSNNWQQYWYDKNSGTYSAAVFPNGANANAWLFTGALNLQAGRYYVLSYYVKTDLNTLFKITLNYTPDYNGQYKTVRNTFPASSGTFVLVNDTIVCEVSNTYYIGFNNYSTSSYSNASLIDDITFTDLNYPNCGTVTAGTISSSVSSICTGNTFTLTSINATNNIFGIRYAWQKSVDGINWININNGYSYQRSILVSQTVPTYYRLTDTCTVSGNSGVSNQVLVNNSSYLNCYCTPVTLNCISSPCNFSNITILYSAINNTSACSANGYGNYTSIGSATVYRGQSAYIQHTVNLQFSTSHCVGAWIDFDHSGTFEENEFVLNNALTGTINITQFPIPANALTGQARLRLKLRPYSPFFAIGYQEACGGQAGSTGEMEDYTLNIIDPPNCTGTISAGTISTVTQICPNNNFIITASNATINQGQMRYAWQKSADNVSWSNINNTSYLLSPLTISQNSNTYYRLTDTCLASGQTAVSNVVTVTTNNIFNCYCIPTASNCNTFGIDSVSFNTIHNASSCSANGYGNYTSISTTINNGTNVPIYLKFKTNVSAKYASVWIDVNRNGIFESSEKVFTGTTTGNFLSGVAYIPFNVIGGETGMRVLVDNFSNTTSGPCSTGLGVGEIEDYKVILNVVNPVTNKFCYYVKSIATGLNDGTNWTNAFTSLSTALSYARTADTIKIAKGSYKPGTTNTSTYLLKDSLIILGGYPDTGNPTDADRNFSANQTVLSGEIGSAVNTDNVRMILQANTVKGFVVDGLIIENGYDGYISTNGPVYFANATGILKNSVIRNNYNASNGCALNIQNSTINLANNFIENNSTSGPDMTAAALNISAKSNVTIVNSVIAKNKAKYVINQNYSSVKMLNTTVFKNYGYSYVHDTSSLVVQNSIFYYNGNDYYIDTAELQKDVYSSINISNTITDVYNYASADYLGQSPKFTDTLNIAGADNKYFTNDDGLRLMNPCSPAINTGSNVFVTTLNTDIAGNIRIKNGVVDIGAYEVQEPLAQQPGILYVNKNATGLNTGLTWQDAFTDLQAAFYRCSDTIKVARGTYPVSSTDVKAYYQLSNNRVVMGGFPNTGSPGNNDFNPELNPTIIDGTVNAGEKCQTIIASKNNNSSSKFIGFEIINSSRPLYIYPTQVATIKVGYKSSPYFEKIKIDCSKNQEISIISIYNNSNPVFNKSAFYNIYPEEPNDYGPRGIEILRNSNPTFLKCYIGKDTTSALAGIRGAVFSINNSGTIIDSCTFYKASGSAIYASNNSNPTIQNSVFNKTGGQSITNIASSPLVKNCVFNDTTIQTNQNGGTISNYSNSNPVFIKCRFNNSFNAYNGGVCYNNNSNAQFKSCVFNKSYASSQGAGFYNIGSQLKLINCVAYDFTINQNSSFPGAAFVTNYDNSITTIVNSTLVAPTTLLKPVISSSTNSVIRFYNSIIWRYGYFAQNVNADDDISTANNNNSATCDIRNSMLYKQQNTAMTNTTVGINPKFIDLSNAAGADGSFYSADDGYKLCNCSYGINKGDNSLVTEASDIMDGSRIYNGTIDIGAYELQANASLDNTFFVKQNAPAGGNGLNWSGAYNSLQKAIQNNCADTIRVAKGIYKPASNSRDSSFNIYSGITLLGGYPDTGNPGEADRNVNTNPTILSGDIGIANDTADNSLSVVKVHCPDTTVILDGLIIEKGNANVNGSSGAGIQSIGNRHLRINNCIIRDNFANTGGGIYSYYASMTVSKTVLRNNSSGYWGGGGFYLSDAYMVIGGLPWTPFTRFKNSVISDNTGSGGIIFGTGVMVTVDNISFENTIFYKNEGSDGAGLRLVYNPYVKIINCDFVRNNSITLTPGVAIRVENPYNYGTLNTYVHNTIFWDNRVLGGPGMYLNNDFNWDNGSSHQETIPYQNLTYSGLSGSGSQTGYGPGNIGTPSNAFRDVENGKGPDNIWMTTDDGLQISNCSATIDKGNNLHVLNIPKDIGDSARIQNQRVDIGAYETTSFVVKIHASDTAICPGTLVTFTATAQNAGTTPVYQWVLNGVNVGTNSAVYSNSLLNNNDEVRVKVKNQNCSANDTAYSNVIKMIVGTSIIPVATITASDTTICAGNTVTFTATATHSNSNSVYQWSVNNVNAGTNSPTFTASNFSNGDIVKVIVTINGTCLSTQTVASNSIVIHVNPALTASVNIVSSANPVCAGSALTFSATAINGGTSPAWQWKVNGNNAGTNSPVFTSLTIVNNDIVTVVMTSSAGCALIPTVTSNAITQQVTSNSQPSVTISSTGITCPGIAITFTANAVNGGTNPLFQWKLNGANTGTQSNTYISNSLNEGDIVAVTLTSNAGCITSPLVNSSPLVIHYTSAVAPAVSITGTATSICSGSPVSFTASPVNGGANPTYQWFINNISSGNNNPVFTTNTLNNNDQVKVVMTSSASCSLSPTATSNMITMNVSPVVTPSVTITSGQGAICSGSTASFTATPTNGGFGPAYQWKKNGINVGTGATYSSNLLANGDIINCVMTSSLTCATIATANSNNLTVTINQTPATPTITAGGPLSFCSGGSVVLTSSAAAGNQWYKDGVILSGAVNAAFTVNASGNYTVVSTISGCASSVSAAVSVTVNALPATPIITLTGNQLTTAAGLSSYQWYLNNAIIPGATANTYTPVVSGLYKVEVANAAGCKATSAEYNFVVTAVSNVVINGVNIICFPNPANDELNIKLSALPVSKTTAKLMDNTGRVVMETVLTGRLQKINVSGIAAGFYLLKITGKKDKGTLKVEVVH